MAKSFLVLDDGTVYEGTSFGYDTEAFGEVVFTTEECGYQKSLTDPSFRGNIVVMTFPLIGNYLIHDEWFQSDKVQASAVICKEYCTAPSTMYPGKTFDQFLKDHRIPGITGVDTRDITLRIRDNGVMMGAVTQDEKAVPELVKKLRKMPRPDEKNLVAEVSRKSVKEFDEGKAETIALLDFGETEATIRALRMRFNVVAFPYDTDADTVINYKLNGKQIKGVHLSNGPGNPAHPAITEKVIPNVRKLAEKLPVFGIGLGCQVIALAFGGKTYKMKFGHHGANEPVLYENRTYITWQNHNYAIDEKSLKGTGLVADQFNVNDKSVEGIRHEKLPVFATQYQPETTAETWETSILFDRFAKAVKEGRL